MDIYGVIGHPISHSKSPLIHSHMLKSAGIKASYSSWEIHPDVIDKFIDAVRLLKIKGVSITIPNKEIVISYLDELTEEARLIGAVNTLYWKNNKLIGDNTDWYGFMMPIRDLSIGDKTKALILGGGGGAKAAIYGLQKLNCKKIIVALRDMSKAAAIKMNFPSVKFISFDEIEKNHTKEFSGEDLIIVNSTPIGMQDAYGSIDKTPMSENALRREASIQGNVLLYDLIYTPKMTKFLNIGRKLNLQIQTASEMFIWQGLKQFQLWHNEEGNYEEIRNLLN